MSFMQPEIYTGHFWEIELLDGSTEYVPADCGTPASLGYDSEEVESAILRHGILGRLSAPGYMDGTCWSPYDNVDDAESDLASDDDDDESY